MIKIKAINYLIPKKITTAKQVEELAYTIFSRNKLGLRPRVEVPAELFENRFAFTHLPNNLILKVKGEIKNAIKLIGSDTTTVKAEVFNAPLNVIHQLKVKAKRAKDAVFAYNKTNIEIKQVDGKVGLFHDAHGSFNKLKHNLLVEDNARASVGKLFGDVETHGKSSAWVNDIKGNATANDTSSILFINRSANSKFVQNRKGTIETLFTPDTMKFDEHMPSVL